MKRWLIVLGVALLTVLSILRVTADDEPSAETGLSSVRIDERLAFDLGRGEKVTLPIPPHSELVHISSSVVVPPEAQAEPGARFLYGIEVALLDDDGERLWSHRYDIEGRISVDPAAPELFASLLHGEADRPTDSRTVTVPLAGLTGTATRLVVEADPGSFGRVLVRATRPLQRSSMLVQLIARRQSLEDRMRLIAGRTSLGYADLPEAPREHALDAYEELLSAEGATGEAYRLSKVLVTDWRAPFALMGGVKPTWIGRIRRSVYNLHGSAPIGIAAPGGTIIELRTGPFIEMPRPILDRFPGEASRRPAPKPPADEVVRFTIPPSGFLDLDAIGEGAQAISLGADVDADVPVFLLLAPERAGVRVGELTPSFSADGDVVAAPDVRLATYARLERAAPVLARIAPGQPALRVTLRSELPDGSTDFVFHRKVSVITRSRGRVLASDVVEADLVRSRFERFRVPVTPETVRPPGQPPALRDATDPLTFYLRMPDTQRGDTTERTVEIRGDPSDLIQLGVPEPGVLADELSLPYRVTLPPSARMRYAQYDRRRWAPLRPMNEAEIAQAGRSVSLEQQARIEEMLPPPPLPEIVLVPKGQTTMHYLVEPVGIGRDGVLPPGAAMRLRDEGRLMIAEKGPNARRITATYRVGKDALGGTASLMIDGEEVARAPIMTLSGSITAQASAGPHRVSVTGLGAEGKVLVDAGPEGGGTALRQKAVYGTDRAHPLSYSINGKRGEHLNLILTIVSSEMGAKWSMRYAFGRSTRPVPFHPALHFTQLSGRIGGTIGDGGTTTAGDNLLLGGSVVGLSRAVIPIGDDLERGVHKILITLETPASVWVRAVLIGQPGGPLTNDTPRVFAEEAL